MIKLYVRRKNSDTITIKVDSESIPHRNIFAALEVLRLRLLAEGNQLSFQYDIVRQSDGEISIRKHRTDNVTGAITYGSFRQADVGHYRAIASEVIDKCLNLMMGPE